MDLQNFIAAGPLKTTNLSSTKILSLAGPAKTMSLYKLELQNFIRATLSQPMRILLQPYPAKDHESYKMELQNFIRRLNQDCKPGNSSTKMQSLAGLAKTMSLTKWSSKLHPQQAQSPQTWQFGVQSVISRPSKDSEPHNQNHESHKMKPNLQSQVQ